MCSNGGLVGKKRPAADTLSRGRRERNDEFSLSCRLTGARVVNANIREFTTKHVYTDGQFTCTVVYASTNMSFTCSNTGSVFAYVSIQAFSNGDI